MFVRFVLQEQAAALALMDLAGEMDDVVFGITSEAAAVFAEYKVTRDGVVMFKNVSSSSYLIKILRFYLIVIIIIV